MSEINAFRMDGLGNDFIIFDKRNLGPQNPVNFICKYNKKNKPEKDECLTCMNETMYEIYMNILLIIYEIDKII